MAENESNGTDKLRYLKNKATGITYPVSEAGYNAIMGNPYLKDKYTDNQAPVPAGIARLRKERDKAE